MVGMHWIVTNIILLSHLSYSFPLINYFPFFQGASATYPAFHCDISQEKLKKHGTAAIEHNFNTVKCQLRDFGRMKQHLKDQISDLEDLEEDFIDVSEFFEHVITNDRNDYERQFRVKGKYHNSVIGNNNSGLDSMEFALGGELHNEIGIINDSLKILFSDLEKENLNAVCTDIKQFLDSPKSAGGAGCSPGQYHGGQYNG